MHTVRNARDARHDQLAWWESLRPAERREAAAAMMVEGLALFVESVIESRGLTGEWVDQKSSPLGTRRHCQLARDGVLSSARKVGRRWLVKRTELETFIASHGGGDGDAQDKRALLAAILEPTAPKRRRSRRG